MLGVPNILYLDIIDIHPFSKKFPNLIVNRRNFNMSQMPKPLPHYYINYIWSLKFSNFKNVLETTCLIDFYPLLKLTTHL